MEPTFRLFWLRETSPGRTGGDLGRAVPAGELPAEVAPRVLALAADGPAAIELHLPYLDRRDLRRRAEILAATEFERAGHVIRPRLEPRAQLRQHAALLLATSDAWQAAPAERDPRYFATWQCVSLALQKALRQWIPRGYFRDLSRYADLDCAYAMVVYSVSRACCGRPRTEFAYDVLDPSSIASACRLILKAVETELARIENLLRDAGQPELARRYLPLRARDILAAVQRRHKRLELLLYSDGVLVNEFIQVGVQQDLDRLSRNVHGVLRRLYGCDFTALGPLLLDEATRALAGRASPKACPESAEPDELQNPVVLAVGDENAPAAVDVHAVGPS